MSHLEDDDQIPKWDDMPKDESILSIAWEDVWAKAKERGLNLTREQIIEAFNHAVRNCSNEAMMGSFWANVDFGIDEAT